MALLEEQFTETLDAGASPITYEGNEGKEQQIAQALWDKLPPQVRMQFGNFAQFFSSGAWKKVLAALQQQMQGPEEIQETETETIGRAPQEGLGALMPAPRPMAHGGLGTLMQEKIVGKPGGLVEPGVKQYGLLKKAFKAVTKPFKKVAKSPLGKAALLYGATAGLGHLATGAQGGWGLGAGKGMGWLAPSAVKGAWLGSALPAGVQGPGTAGILGKYGLTQGAGSFIPTLKGAGVAALAPFAMAATGNWEPETLENLRLKAEEFGYDYSQMIRDIQNAEDEEEYLAVLAKYNLSASDLPPWGSQKRAEGGRIRAQEGGLMDLGGMEKDYRQDGGFVPIGGEEKADDVPARLSKNEFVFTADAVRAAGAGDIDQGAEVMENVMKNLERGGEISEESQGQGARDMFQVSERLSEVV
jgi:hypothetical protein